MFKWLKRWLGWEIDTDLWNPLAREIRPQDASKPKLPIQPKAQKPGTAARPPAQRRKNGSPMDRLHNPHLTLDKPADDGFDPYNTGAFNRSTSWEKIGRQRKR